MYLGMIEVYEYINGRVYIEDYFVGVRFDNKMRYLWDEN